MRTIMADHCFHCRGESVRRDAAGTIKGPGPKRHPAGIGSQKGRETPVTGSAVNRKSGVIAPGEVTAIVGGITTNTAAHSAHQSAARDLEPQQMPFLLSIKTVFPAEGVC